MDARLGSKEPSDAYIDLRESIIQIGGSLAAKSGGSFGRSRSNITKPRPDLFSEPEASL